MSENYNLAKDDFQHIVLEGSAYDVGKMQGKILGRNKRMYRRIKQSMSSFLSSLGLPSSGKPDPKTLGFQDFSELQSFFEEYSPGLNDEMQGFADGFGVEVNELPYYCATFQNPRNCSQIAVLSSIADDNHVRVGRSYEWNQIEEDLQLCTTRVDGKAKHIGFSIFLFGRADGLNEHGVSATFTGAGIFGVSYKHRGFQSHLVIRSILDNCKSVQDALKFLQKTPTSGFFNLLVADKNGNAVLVEFSNGVCDVQMVDEGSARKFVCSANHYTLPATAKFNSYNCGIIHNSRRRVQLLSSTLDKAAPQVTSETLLALLSKKFPEGVCDHYYSQGFGTVWSSIFDLTIGKADVCFGAPTHNKWQSFTLDEPAGAKKYPAVFPDNKGEWPY